MIKPIFLAISVLMLTVSSSVAMSKAEALAAIFGGILGHIDRCGLTVQRWHAEGMGRAISNAFMRSSLVGVAMEAERRMASV